jgi:hypothetical protein
MAALGRSRCCFGAGGYKVPNLFSDKVSSAYSAQSRWALARRSGGFPFMAAIIAIGDIIFCLGR